MADPSPTDRPRQPVHADVAHAVAKLTADQREFFEERAGILEFDALMPIANADREALRLNRLHFGLSG